MPRLFGRVISAHEPILHIDRYIVEPDQSQSVKQIIERCLQGLPSAGSVYDDSSDAPDLMPDGSDIDNIEGDELDVALLPSMIARMDLVEIDDTRRMLNARARRLRGEAPVNDKGGYGELGPRQDQPTAGATSAVPADVADSTPA